MQQILAITGPIYLLIALGYLAVRGGLFSKPDMRVLGKFVISFCLPALVFNALSQRSLGEIVHGDFLLAYALGSLALLLGGTFYARRLRGKPMALSALQGLGMAAPNSGFIGFPVLLQLIGPPAAVALALCMLVENLLILPLALVLADSSERRNLAWHQALLQSLRGLLRNPLIIAILAGFACALFGLTLPTTLARAVQLVASASSPLALFVIGGALVGLQVGGMLRDVSEVVIGKLVLHPLAVLGVVMLLPPMDPLLRTAALVMPAMPMLSIYPVMAQKYQHEGFCAAVLLAATVTSFFTLSALLWWLGSVPGVAH